MTNKHLIGYDADPVRFRHEHDSKHEKVTIPNFFTIFDSIVRIFGETENFGEKREISKKREISEKRRIFDKEEKSKTRILLRSKCHNYHDPGFIGSSEDEWTE